MNNNKSMIARIGLAALSLICFGMLVYRAYDQHDFAVSLYGNVSYYLVFALFLVWINWCGAYLYSRGFSGRAFFQRHWIGLLGALVITTVAWTSVPPKFRVLSDETNLVSVSQAMIYDKTVFNHTMGKRYYENFYPINGELEKRPLMFPFFVHLVHLVRGYSAENAFIINAIFLFALLGTIAMVVRNAVGRMASLAAVILVASYPLITSVSMSAGFDLMATVFTAIVFVALFEYLRNPNADSFLTLWVNLLVFCNIRYESSVFTGLILLGTVVFGYFKWEHVTKRFWAYVISPFLLLPLVVQRILIPHPYENAPGVPAFSWDHFREFTRVFFGAQTNFDFVIPHAQFLNWIALPILAALAVMWLKGKVRFPSPAHGHFTIIFGVSLVTSLALFFSYYFGNYVHPASARFFMNISIVAALLPVALRMTFSSIGDRRLLVFAVAAFVFYHPISVQGKFTNTQTLVRETDVTYDWLRRNPNKNILVIASRPGQYTALDYGAVDTNFANANKRDLINELRRHLYEEIIVFQRVQYDTGTSVLDGLDPELRLETLEEMQTSATDFMRVSRVKLN